MRPPLVSPNALRAVNESPAMLGLRYWIDSFQPEWPEGVPLVKWWRIAGAKPNESTKALNSSVCINSELVLRPSLIASKRLHRPTLELRAQ